MFKKFMLAPLAAAVLSACAVGPNYHAPETPSAEKFDGIESLVAQMHADVARTRDIVG